MNDIVQAYAPNTRAPGLIPLDLRVVLSLEAPESGASSVEQV